ncbi:competence type IV pilus minor pilin ComGE [Bacillus swezeyi]|uniref:Chromosome partitioning protein ParA n=1 Tax=Bacillus swezeyi TaxID=1925020 RepID=A0A1R1QB28_9BACI|nr:competence type IV pilus minor pilin ComGE [Bacillus swezeyi]MEC1261155.1 competence type IV pilus minor pilin ComGE [Bacillus swezeyi]MED1739726.1 competence type IV pilus minor pilin ComGE [Bacillus swezeyi]MED2929374.1 competence type IV pilus minor pilin ComGE [Bacillus swezeyi]MED2941186.1 competence type IV pilus minor pilin ComGE [Bacillus swezeyi]MED2963599.1 competence type IV pilus minor pilin ComGE [Bacillus swezeyi]
MFKRNKGFTTIETVSALGIWTMITVLFIPMFHQLALKNEMARKEEEAYRLLDEQISRYTLTGSFQPQETAVYQGTAYYIEWKEKGDDYKVCISIKPGKEQKHCLSILQTKGLYPS